MSHIRNCKRKNMNWAVIGYQPLILWTRDTFSFKIMDKAPDEALLHLWPNKPQSLHSGSVLLRRRFTLRYHRVRLVLTLLFWWHGEVWPDSPGLSCVLLWGEVWSHLTDVVVDGVCVPLTHCLEHAVFVSVDLRHWHVDAVGVVVGSLRSVGRYGLERERRKMC